MNSLKLAFRDEVKPDDYLTRVWATAFLVGGIECFLAMYKNGQIDVTNLVPMGGGWHSRDAYGNLYLETWSSIAVSALQIGFTLWAVILVFMGIRRLFSSNKYVFACFSMGIGFGMLAAFLPSIVTPLLKMLVEKMPYLVAVCW